MSISKEVETIISKLKITDISPEEKIERLERIYDMYQFAGDVDAIVIETVGSREKRSLPGRMAVIIPSYRNGVRLN